MHAFYTKDTEDLNESHTIMDRYILWCWLKNSARTSEEKYTLGGLGIRGVKVSFHIKVGSNITCQSSDQSKNSESSLKAESRMVLKRTLRDIPVQNLMIGVTRTY